MHGKDISVTGVFALWNRSAQPDCCYCCCCYIAVILITAHIVVQTDVCKLLNYLLIGIIKRMNITEYMFYCCSLLLVHLRPIISAYYWRNADTTDCGLLMVNLNLLSTQTHTAASSVSSEQITLGQQSAIAT
jgi:hypothetical protein